MFLSTYWTLASAPTSRREEWLRRIIQAVELRIGKIRAVTIGLRRDAFEHLPVHAQYHVVRRLGVNSAQEFSLFVEPHWVPEELPGRQRVCRYLYGENGNMHRGFDHRRFANAVNPLKSRWLVSYNDDLLIRRYFKGHRITTIQVHGEDQSGDNRNHPE